MTKQTDEQRSRSPGQDPVSRRAFLRAVRGSGPAAGHAIHPSSAPASAIDVYGRPAKADPAYGWATYTNPQITPQNALFVQSYRPDLIPRVNAELGHLMLDGLVNMPIELSYTDIKRLPYSERTHVLECGGNRLGGSLIGNARWGGVPFPELLSQVQVIPGVQRAVFYAADGYSTALDLSILQRDDALLAFAINGEALSPAHGYPLRLIVPGWYGFKMPKWITRIRFIAGHYAGYWERRGWTTEMLRTRATIHMPHHGATIRGTVAIQGIAVAGDGGINRVEVRVDRGAWMDAQLRLPDSPGGWTQWYVHWTPPASGGYLIEVRAHDRQSDVQGMHDGDYLHRIVLYADLPTDDD